MKLLDWTLPDPAANLALDQALLDLAQQTESHTEVLRLWESPEPVVVLGRSSRCEREVRVAECRRRNIPIFRRSSGGTAIVVGPGCLMYGLVLSYELHPRLRMVDVAHRFVLERICRALQPLAPEIRCHGISDLVISGERKVSGNSLRCHETHLLYHGTLLYDFPLELIDACLLDPPREPEYRAGRTHEAFLANLPVSAGQLRPALVAAWDATERLDHWPEAATRRLVAQRYSRGKWNEEGRR